MDDATGQSEIIQSIAVIQVNIRIQWSRMKKRGDQREQPFDHFPSPTNIAQKRLAAPHRIAVKLMNGYRRVRKALQSRGAPIVIQMSMSDIDQS